jgi:transcriptional regulator
VYIPPLFAQTDRATLEQFIEEYGFALLCSVGEDGTPFASHLPLLLERQPGALGVLVGHMARSNPQWQHADGKPVLAVFSGPHAYISPAWYESENVVPTWNYVAVHVTGVLHAVHDPGALRKIVEDAVAFHESFSPRPWQPEWQSRYIDGMLRGIVGVRIEITTIEGKWKLSQNQPAERREKVVRALRAKGGADANAVADLMERMR